MDLTRKRRTEIVFTDDNGDEHVQDVFHARDLAVVTTDKRIEVREAQDEKKPLQHPAWPFTVNIASFPLSFAVILHEDPLDPEISQICSEFAQDLAQTVDEDPGDQAVREMFIDVDAKPEAPQPDPNPGAQLGNWMVYRQGETYGHCRSSQNWGRPSGSEILQVGLHENAARILASALRHFGAVYDEHGNRLSEALLALREGRLN